MSLRSAAISWKSLCHYAERWNFCRNAIMLSVIMSSTVKLSAVKQSVITPTVILPSVVAPLWTASKEWGQTEEPWKEEKDDCKKIKF